MYSLSRPITLSELRHCAYRLHSRHRILQVSVQTHPNKPVPYYIHTPHLQLYIQQLHVPAEPYVLMHSLIEAGERGPKSLAQRGAKTSLQKHSSAFLPWRLVLSTNGDHIIFVAPHSICDGVSLEIIGMELVYALNGKETEISSDSVVELAEPMERFFKRPTRKMVLKGYMSIMRSRFKKVELCGVDNENIPRQWHTRSPIGEVINVSMQQISSFHRKCTENGFSLNSGLISAFYEAVACTPAFQTNGRKPVVCIPMDARRRVSTEKKSIMSNIGPYLGAILTAETGDEGHWVDRAKNIHGKVHDGNVSVQFPGVSIALRLEAKYAKTLLRGRANSKNLGRQDFVAFSNLGRTERIENANKECSAELGNEKAVRIDKMWYDESGCAVGFVLSVHVATVGQNVSISIGSIEPLVGKETLSLLCNQYRKLLSEA